MRIFTRNVGLLFTASKGTHEGTGRFAENAVAWLMGRSPPAPRYLPGQQQQQQQQQGGGGGGGGGATDSPLSALASAPGEDSSAVAAATALAEATDSVEGTLPQ